MTSLVTALYAEGTTDHRFLPLIIQRTAVQILSQRGRTIVDVLEPMLVEPEKQLTQIFAEALASRTRRVRRRHTIAELYEPLARTINLAALRQLPSYQQFVTDLTQALIALNFVQ